MGNETSTPYEIEEEEDSSIAGADCNVARRKHEASKDRVIVY
jgi:hypothetical protein